MTSPRDAGQALVKIAAYCRYREKIQKNLFEKEERVEAVDVFQQIEKGFPDFMTACVNGTELADADTPHPFDSHPPLGKRLESLGLDPEAALKTPSTLPAVSDSWFSAIEGAEAIEAEQWKAFEERLHKAHNLYLAWHFKPEGEAEIAHVVKHFPEVQFATKKGLTATLDYEKVRVSDWDAPVFFSTVTSCRLEDHLGGKRLVIAFTPAEGQKGETRKIAHTDFKKEGADFLKTFEMYYGRHMTAKKHLEQKALEASV
jgi:hypothetical protein